MSDTTWKEAALADFRAWLERLEQSGDGVDPTPDEPLPELLGGPDLHALQRELAALRQELRLQTREQARALRLAEGEREAHLEAVRHGAARACLTPMLEVRDALERGLAAATAVVGAPRWRRPRGVEAVAEGYTMALERFDRVLYAAGVRPVPTVGQAFDPRTMVAVQARHDPTAAPEAVVEQVRAGFVAGDGTLLRAAEVVVNHVGPSPGDQGP